MGNDKATEVFDFNGSKFTFTRGDYSPFLERVVFYLEKAKVTELTSFTNSNNSKR